MKWYGSSVEATTFLAMVGAYKTHSKRAVLEFLMARNHLLETM